MRFKGGKNSKRKAGAVVPWGIVFPGVFFALIGHFIAPLKGAFYAFTDFKGIGDYSFIWFDNFIKIFQSKADWLALVNTIKLAVPFLILVNVIGLILALILLKKLKTRNILKSVYFIPAVMIPLAVTQVWKYILNYDGPLNIILRTVGLETWCKNWLGDADTALWCILFVMLWQNAGYAMIIFNAGLSSISEDLYEAAAIDGANPWQKFKSITLPMLAPSFTIVVTLMTVTGLRVFDQVLGLTGGGPAGTTQTLASDFYMQTWTLSNYGYGTALALILTVLVSVAGVSQSAVLSKKEDNMS